MLEIKDKYISVGYGPLPSFGGSQMRAPSRTVREVGCGVIAALDLLLYLVKTHPDCGCAFFRDAIADGVIDEQEYNELVTKLSRRFFPLIPKLGINGIMLAAGLNAFFLRYSLPWRAVWGLGRRKLWDEIAHMLSQDIPVILSIGPNFPLFWQKNTLRLYSAGRNGELVQACCIRAHYVTVTGMDEEKLRISSWGREYFIKRREYADYVRFHSGGVVSNVVKIRTVRH